MDCEKKIEQFFSSKKIKDFNQYELNASGNFKKPRESTLNQNNVQRKF